MKQISTITILFILLILTSQQPVHAGLFSRKTDSIQVIIDQKQLILPGETFKIGVISYHKNGKIKRSIGMKGGRVFWWRYESEIIGGKRTSGKITVNNIKYPTKGKYIRIKIWPRKHKELAKMVLVPLNYEQEITFIPKNNFDKAPGCSFKAELQVKFNNGVIRKISDLNSRKTLNNYSLYSEGFEQRKNRFTIETDFRNIIDHQVNVRVQSKRNPSVSTLYSVLLDYKHTYRLNLYGHAGNSGFDGRAGFSGNSGDNGSCGQHGGAGSPGYDGPDLSVSTDMYYDSTLNCELLYVYAEENYSGNEYFYLINPDGGKLHVKTQGGRGGNGGDGGNGGAGGNGDDGRIWYETVTKTRIVKKPFTETVTKKVKKRRTTGTGEEEEYEETVTEQITVYKNVKETYTEQIKHQEPGEDGGDGGHGGAGGEGGPGGWGGNIYLYFTDDALSFQDRIVAKSSGGSGGHHGNGGRGGYGGKGGKGDPDGRSGQCGYNGPKPIGWASSGGEGEIFMGHTEEFFFYGDLAQK